MKIADDWGKDMTFHATSEANANALADELVRVIGGNKTLEAAQRLA